MIKGIKSGSLMLNKSIKERLGMYGMSSGYPNHSLLEPRSVIKNCRISEKDCTMPGGRTASAGWINTEMFSGLIAH